MNDRTVIPQEISEDAAEWFGRLETERPSEAIRAEFVRWLTRSPVHIEEFLSVSALHHALSRELKADPEWLAGVLADASAPDENVVWMKDLRGSATGEARPRPPRSRFLWKAAAVLLAAIGVAAVVKLTGLTAMGRGDRFATAVGEQRQFVLSDGSDVLLNTNSEIRVRMSDELRRVDLVRGEALFSVAKDPERPFRVLDGTAAVEAIGTRFNVYHQREQTVVTVVEGRVLVSLMEEPAQSPPAVGTVDRARPDKSPPISAVTPDRVTERGVVLDTGQMVTLRTDGTVAELAPTDVDRATSWTRGRMVFDSDTLNTVVAEFNRYNAEQLVIADPALSGRRITGIFRIDAPESFLALLSSLDDISVERNANGSREIRRAQESPQD